MKLPSITCNWGELTHLRFLGLTITVIAERLPQHRSQMEPGCPERKRSACYADHHSGGIQMGFTSEFMDKFSG